MEYVRRNRILVVTILILLTFVLVMVTNRPSSNVDIPPEGTDINPATHANIVSGEELLYSLGSMEAYERISADLHTFARTAYEAYGLDSARVVGFEVISKVTKEGGVVAFTGRYGSSNHKVQVSAKLLKNNRILTSITDLETLLNIDNFLPSHNPIDQFIGTLPIHNGSFSILYVPEDIVQISIPTRQSGLYEQAYDYLLEKLGKEVVGGLNLSVTFPTPSFSE